MLPVNTSLWQPPITEPHSLSSLSDQKKRLLTGAKNVRVSERIGLLLLLMHKKWIADIHIDGNQISDEQIHSLLKDLELAYQPNSYINSKGKQINWIQVAGNPELLQYVMQRRDSLTVLEAGVLYGYPMTHVLGFMHLIPRARTMPKNSPALHYLSGVYSRDYKDSEVGYFNQLWEEMRESCLELVIEAEKEFDQK